MNKESNQASEQPDFAELLSKAQSEGSVRVIVGLQQANFPKGQFVPEGELSSSQVVDQQNAINDAQEQLQTELQGTGFEEVRKFDTVPYVALKLSPEALKTVQSSALVSSIQEDKPEELLAKDQSKTKSTTKNQSASSDTPPDPPALAQSVPLIQGDQMWAAGFTGSGQTVAVLDTGVDSSHPFLANKVVEEACFSANSNCPNGQTAQTGPGSGVNCTYAVSGCRHGTHVAGIAAGKGGTFSGVAKDADIMAVQVFSEFTGADCVNEDPCTLSYKSDQLAGLEQVYNLRDTRTFTSVNMSIGGGQFFSNCDGDARKSVIDNLRSANIATVIASGNSGFTDSMSAPACISSAVSVGSTTKADTLSFFSNSASFLSLLAPGSDINSSVPGGGFEVFNGTSMATPHVTGAWALLRQRDSSANVDTILSGLQSTGTLITDTRPGGGITKPRINVFDASVAIDGPIDTTPPMLNLPSDITQTATDNNGAVVNYSATATDDVDGNVPVNCDPASGSTFPIGTTPVNCSATDNAGNQATGSFNVTINLVDNQPPPQFTKVCKKPKKHKGGKKHKKKKCTIVAVP